jgi:plastocyanin
VFKIRRFVGTGFAIAVIAGSLPLAVACGGGGDDDNDDTGALGNVKIDAPRNENTNAPEQIIEVKDNEFVPAEVTIKPGTKIIWKWVDTQAPHSIQLSGNTSPEQTSGTYERTFDQTGNSFAYQCGVHKAAMAGRIVIE